MTDELAHLDATATAELIRSGELSPREAVDAAIARAEAVNPDINAIIHPTFDSARAAASSADLPDGPFSGVPFVVKDLGLQQEGEPYHCGSKFLKEHGYRAAITTELAHRFRAAGLVSLGRTNTPEQGSLPTTENDAYGPSLNPWNTAHSTGGSSGGSAAAVAAGVVSAGHANDGGGSIRIPASECGLVGLKPTRARVTLSPIGESWGGAVIDGVVTRSVRDTAGILDAIAGPAPGDPYWAPPQSRPYTEEVGAPTGQLRIGSATESASTGVAADAVCRKAVERTLGVLADMGNEVDPDARPTRVFDDAQTGSHLATIIAVGSAVDIERWQSWTGQQVPPESLEPHNQFWLRIGREATGVQYLEALNGLHAFTRRVAQWWADGWDLLVTPTIAEPPPRIGEFVSTDENPMGALVRAGQLVAFTSAFNITGQPAISLPLHWSDGGLPVGVQLVAAHGREDLLIRVAAQLEEAMPWAGRVPPVFAG